MKHIKRYWIVIVIIFFISIFIKPAFCFFILGSLFTYLGISAIIFLNRIKKSGIRCQGKILSFESDSDGYKTPIVEFKTIYGDLVTEKPTVYASTDLSKFRTYENLIETEVDILYDPNDSKQFVIAQEEGFNYFVFVLFFLAGLFFIGLSISAFLGYIKIG